MTKLRLWFFALIFILLVITPILLNRYYNYLLSPISREENLQIFVIKPAEPVVTIAKNLGKANLIRNNLAFRLLVAQMGIGQKIQAGDFRLSPHLSSREIATELTHGAIDIWITFPEGIRIEEMAQLIESKLKTPTNDRYQFDKKEFESLAQEGYLFPDTYLIPKDATTSDIVNRLKTTFEQKVPSKILKQGAKNDLSEEEVVILASLIEREAKTNEEKPEIAGILINRLAIGMALQVDATVQYAKGYSSAQNTWWPPVSPADYQSVKSLYNTYLHPGLPPGPIANPGLETIRAAADPSQTDYFYYLHDSQGKIHYAKTVEEHNQNIEQYLYQ